jgi:hypothetical protein
MTTATRGIECNAAATRLLMALELSRRQWMIGFTTAPGCPVRQRRLRAADWRRLPAEIAAAKQRFGLAPNAAVESCYEAGPDGQWRSWSPEPVSGIGVSKLFARRWWTRVEART